MQDGKFRVGFIKASNEEPIPEDEPVFIFRARDNLALGALMAYENLCLEQRCTRYQMDGIKAAILRFKRYKLLHPEKMKQPGITKGL